MGFGVPSGKAKRALETLSAMLTEQWRHFRKSLFLIMSPDVFIGCVQLNSMRKSCQLMGTKQTG
jgi:hypothetical protein